VGGWVGEWVGGCAERWVKSVSESVPSGAFTSGWVCRCTAHTVSRQVNQDSRIWSCSQAFGRKYSRWMAISQHPDKRLWGNLKTPPVNLDIASIHIDSHARAASVEHGWWLRVARVAAEPVLMHTRP
jgi:hypothetical protein